MKELQAELAIEDSVVVVDMEAGLEHLKRGTPAHTDVLMVIAEPFFRSAETAVRTARLGTELGIESVGVVANKVRDEGDEEAVRKIFARSGIPVIGVVPFDDAVAQADRQATSVLDIAPDAPIVSSVERIIDSWLGQPPPA